MADDEDVRSRMTSSIAHAPPRATKRQKRAHDSTDVHERYATPTRLSHRDYTIGWICALPCELVAAKAMLDATHDPLPSDRHDKNVYTLGQIHQHNVVITILPKGRYGTNQAAFVASNMQRSYPSVHVRLLVGIGGGVPGKFDVRLGDVIVGEKVIQWDLGKTLVDGQFESTAVPCRPPSELMNAAAELCARHETQSSEIPAILDELQQQYPHLATYTDNSQLQDWLYERDYPHNGLSDTCEQCDSTRRRLRDRRTSKHPQIYHGTIASGNQVIKDAPSRDQLAATFHALCFEMEAAGLGDNLPHLVIRGICDYADSHKNKEWQPYAATTAAAYAKELLSVLHSGVPEVLESHNASTSRQAHRQELLQSLYFEQIDSRYEDIKPAQAKTCEWFLRDPRYLEWRDPAQLVNHHGFLWIKGKPGAGKSTLMKFLFGRTAQDVACHEEIFLSFFFHARGVDLEKSTEGMYRSLLFQLLKRVPQLQCVLDDLSRHIQSPSQSHDWKLKTLQGLLSQAISKLGMQRVTFFVDALDECDTEQVRDMIETFEQIGQRGFSSGAQFYVCFSSRHYPFIQIDAGIELALEDQTGHGEDMEKYVRSKLKIGASKAVQEVKSEIIRKAAGVFLWVVLVVDILGKEFGRGNVHKVKTRLNELPPNLSELFKDMLRRDTEDMGSLLLCIQWILFAARPLKVEEFYFAVLSGFDPDPDILCEWDPEFIDIDSMKRFVLNSSKGLAEVTRLKSRNVQFIHESVRDFLVKDNGLQELFPHLQQNLDGLSHKKLRQCCETYMQVDVSTYIRIQGDLPKCSSKEGKDLRLTIGTKFPFLDYAIRHVLRHAESSTTEPPAREFVRNFDLDRWVRLNNILEQFEVRRYNANVTLQYILAEKSLGKLLSEVLRTESVNESSGGRYDSPLAAAAASGGLETAVLLLHKGHALEKGDRTRTPALEACEHGHDNMTQMLVQKGACIVLQKPRTHLLSLAIDKQLENTVRSLLERGADVHAPGASYGGVLQAASHWGHEWVVELLLDNGVDVNIQGGDFCNALQTASFSGHEGVTKLLLSRGADVNAQGGKYGNALQAASAIGHEGIVKLLLDRGAAVNAQGGGYGTALIAASYQPNAGIVKLFLDQGADVNAQGGYYGNALQAALCGRNEGIIKLLLDQGANINTQGGYYGNALQAASYKTNEGIVKLLLDQGANVNTQGGYYGNALQAASCGTNEGIVKLLLDQGADVNAQGGVYGNALQAASYGRNEGIIKLLLDQGADVNAQGGYYGNALQAASCGTKEGIVKLVLDQGANVNAQGGYYGNALQAASCGTKEGIVKLLLDQGANINAQGGVYGNAQHAAKLRGSGKIVKLLRERQHLNT